MSLSMEEMYRRVKVQRELAARGEQMAARWPPLPTALVLSDDRHRLGCDVLRNVWLVTEWLSADERMELGIAVRENTRWAGVSGRQVAVLGGFPVLGERMLPLALPFWMAPVQKRLLEGRVFARERTPNHCLLNCYKPGMGLNAHNDGPLYEPRVAIVSLDSACVFEFVAKDVDEVVVSVFVPCGSLLVFDEDAYLVVRHRIPFATVDTIAAHCLNAADSGVGVGGTVARGTRLSLTMRHVRDVNTGFNEALMTDAERQELRVREASFLRSISEKP